MLLEQYRDLKWHLRQSSAFKIFSLREGWSFQTRRTEHSCERGGALPTAPGGAGAAAAGERAGGAASPSPAPHTQLQPRRAAPQGWVWETRGAHLASRVVTSTSERPGWVPNVTRATSPDLSTGVLEGSGLQARCLPGPLAPPSSPRWALVLLPPTPIPPPAAVPIPRAPGSSHPPHHFTLPRPSVFVGLEPTTHSWARSSGKIFLLG